MAGPQFVYVMKGLSKTYPGGKQVLKDIWLSFYPGAKIGIVGVNGAGKSTLMRIMAGMDKEFTGEAWAADGVRMGYLSQEPQLDPSKNVRDNVLEGVAKKKALIDTSRHTVIESAHPSPLSAHNGFFGSKPFSRANAALVEAGLDPIDWRIPI